MNITKILKVKELSSNNKGIVWFIVAIPIVLGVLTAGFIYFTNQKAIDSALDALQKITWNVLGIIVWVLLNLPIVLMLSEFVIVVITVTSSKGSVPGLVITFISLNWKLFRAILDIMIDIGTFLVRIVTLITGAASKFANPIKA